MHAVAISSETHVRADAATRPDQAYPVGNLSRNGHRRGCHRIHALASVSHQCAGFMGAGSVVLARNRAALSCGHGHDAAHNHGKPVPCSRCALGTGRWLALSCACRSDRRALGRSGCIGFHRDKAAGTPVRGRKCPLLVDPSCRHARLKCGARPLADWIGPVGPAALRRPGTGDAALVSRSVSLTPDKARPMDGDI